MQRIFSSFSSYKHMVQSRSCENSGIFSIFAIGNVKDTCGARFARNPFGPGTFGRPGFFVQSPERPFLADFRHFPGSDKGFIIFGKKLP